MIDPNGIEDDWWLVVGDDALQIGRTEKLTLVAGRVVSSRNPSTPGRYVVHDETLTIHIDSGYGESRLEFHLPHSPAQLLLDESRANVPKALSGSIPGEDFDEPCSLQRVTLDVRDVPSATVD